MDICNCHQDLDVLLCAIPNEWRKGIIDAICAVLADPVETCDLITQCETKTNLGPFYMKDMTKLCFVYTNEKGIKKERCFDISLLLESSLDDIDPLCLMSAEDWADLSHVERLNAITEAYCDCCVNTTTTTSTSTTSTSSTSTTSTTSTSTTSTTSTSTTSTTSTSTTSTTTTTTTLGYEVRITNTLFGVAAESVSGIAGFTSTPSLPCAVGDDCRGFHTSFTGTITVVVSGPPLMDGNISLYRNNVLTDFENLLTSDIYDKTVIFNSDTYADGDLIEIAINIGIIP